MHSRGHDFAALGWPDGGPGGIWMARPRPRWRLGRATTVPAHLKVPGLGRHYGPRWWPRHDTVYGLGPSLALYGLGRAVLFSVVPGPAHRVSAIWPSI
jgi:hypothetical protein